jgi:O-antigen/teichoic acid export membrane protein
LIIVAHVLVPIVYGPAFLAVLPLTSILICEAILSGVVMVLSQAFMATGRPAVVTIIEACWTVTAIGFLFLLVPRMNLTGAATALILAAFTRLLLVIAAYPIILRHRIPNLLIQPADLMYIRDKFAGPRRESRPAAAERIAH